MGNFITSGPNEALIVSGGGRQYKVIVGGTKFVWTCTQQAEFLSLEIRTLDVESVRVLTSLGVAVNVVAVAQVRVGDTEDDIRRASNQFLGIEQNEIKKTLTQTLEGHQRSIVGELTVEEMYKDRHKFAALVAANVTEDLKRMGMKLISYTIKDVNDEHGYLNSLGQKRIAEVKKDADISVAITDRDCQSRIAEAQQEQETAKNIANSEMEKSKRDFELAKNRFDQEVNTLRAESELAKKLQETKTQQQIQQELQEIKVVERKKKQIEVQQQENTRQEIELQHKQVLPAKYELLQTETVSEANRLRFIRQGEADALTTRVLAQADAAVTKAKGQAEYVTVSSKAEAFKQFGEAAVIEQMISMIPKVTNAISTELSKVGGIVFITDSTDTGEPLAIETGDKKGKSRSTK